MKDWQFNILFFVGVGGAIVLLIGPSFGLDIAQNPTALGGVGAILTYVLTQKYAGRPKNGEKKREADDRPDKGVDDGPR